jgi:rhodanese-related sulfurtransferase
MINYKGLVLEIISVLDFKKILESKNKEILLLDVRSPEEYSFCNIGGVNIPLNEISNRLSEISDEKTIYCLCHHGMRSLYAAQFLSSQGYPNVVNIEGGIDQWSLQVDNQILRY